MLEPDSFYVGGQEIADATGGQLRVGQMYVRRFPVSSTLTPVVLVHGGTMNGSHYEVTPDGRPGLAPLIAATGRTVYVVDLPGTGRSNYYAPHHGPLVHWSSAALELMFTGPKHHGLWPEAAGHTQWPGTGLRGDPVFEAFYASTVGSLSADPTNELRIRAAGQALTERIGACHLLTHSQSGPYGWHIADAAAELVQSVVALEPQGPPWFDNLAPAGATPRRPFGITSAPLSYDPPLAADAAGLPWETPDGTNESVQQTRPPRRLTNLQDTPVLLVTAEASYHHVYDRRTVDFLRDAGVTVDHVQLHEHDIRGNGHLMAVEKNNPAIAQLIADWLEKRDR